MSNETATGFLGPLGDLSIEELIEFADRAAKDEILPIEYRHMLCLALQTAARWKQDALAFNRYLTSTEASTALLARKFVSKPAITVEDRRHIDRGFVIVIEEGASKSRAIDHKFSKSTAEWIMKTIRDYGAHTAEATRRSIVDYLKARNSAAVMHRVIEGIEKGDDLRLL